MSFGQLIIGPPGSGKTTYCTCAAHFFGKMNRPAVIINLDSANDNVDAQYKPFADIRDLVKMEDVMDEHDLGPNGAMVHCLEHLEQNLTWLVDKLKPLAGKAYFLFDMPGQTELYVVHHSLRRVVDGLVKALSMNLCAVHLVDSSQCLDPCKLVSAATTALCGMLNLEAPAVNVLSKMDICDVTEEELDDSPRFHVENMIAQLNSTEVFAAFKRYNTAIGDILADFDYVSFLPLCAMDHTSLAKTIQVIDYKLGYVPGVLGETSDDLLTVASKMSDELYNPQPDKDPIETHMEGLKEVINPWRGMGVMG